MRSLVCFVKMFLRYFRIGIKSRYCSAIGVLADIENGIRYLDDMMWRLRIDIIHLNFFSLYFFILDSNGTGLVRFVASNHKDGLGGHQVAVCAGKGPATTTPTKKDEGGMTWTHSQGTRALPSCRLKKTISVLKIKLFYDFQYILYENTPLVFC